MPRNEVVIIKIPEGSIPPAGFVFIRNIRGKDIYQKDVQKVSKKQVDDLADLFGGLNVQILPEDEISRLMTGMSIGGRRKKTRRMKRTKRRGRKSRRN